MASFFFFILSVIAIPVNIQASVLNCKTVTCNHGSTEIRYPFWLRNNQPHHCGCPSFELVCKENTSMIHFPSYGHDLIIKSISYETKRLDLEDPKNCVHEVFLNLDLSRSSPFHYFHVVKNYTYLNCSSQLSPSFTEIRCLSGSGYHMYTVESSLAVPRFCRAVKTVAIPFAYSPYISDNSFGLELTWDLPGCKYLEQKDSKEASYDNFST